MPPSSNDLLRLFSWLERQPVTVVALLLLLGLFLVGKYLPLEVGRRIEAFGRWLCHVGAFFQAMSSSTARAPANLALNRTTEGSPANVSPGEAVS